MRNLITTKGAYHEPNHRTTIVHLERCHEEGFWMDMQDPDEEDFKILAGAFKFHPLTIEDVKNRGQRPKLDDYDGYRFMVLFSARWTDAGELETDEYHLYISDDYLVIDAVVDPTFDALQRLDSTIDELESAIVDRADPEQLRRIYALKHSVTQLRQLLGAERDLFQRLITESLSDPDLGAYYRDVYDHVIRQYESVDSLRDLLTGAMDVYLSTVSNRLNVTMRTLTVIASLFLPITFLTGFYGMNFAYLTSVLEPHQLAFPIAIGTMLAATAFQLYIFKRRGWI